MGGRFWTEEEIKFVEDNFSDMTHQEMADHLGRSYSAVQIKCSLLNLRKSTEFKAQHPYSGIYDGMISRCYHHNTPYYKHYGGRGIKVCDEWKDPVDGFWRFVRYMNDNHGRNTEGLQLDRINNNGNYQPGNVRWVTVRENLNNTRRTKYVTAFGETKGVSQWVLDKRCVVARNTILERIESGMTPEDAITTPSRIAHAKMWTEEEKIDVVTRIKNGENRQSIADEYRVTKQSIHNIYHKNKNTE